MDSPLVSVAELGADRPLLEIEFFLGQRHPHSL